MPVRTHLWVVLLGIISIKVSHADLEFGVLPGFIIRSGHTRLQVSVCSGYDRFVRATFVPKLNFFYILTL